MLPFGTEHHTRLVGEHRKFYHFIQGASQISRNQRETIFISMLESLHADEAEVLVLTKTQNLQVSIELHTLMQLKRHSQMSSGVTEVDMGSFAVLFSDCDPSQADDKELPTNAYLVEYIQGETSHFDIVMSSKKSRYF